MPILLLRDEFFFERDAGERSAHHRSVGLDSPLGQKTSLVEKGMRPAELKLEFAALWTFIMPVL